MREAFGEQRTTILTVLIFVGLLGALFGLATVLWGGGDDSAGSEGDSGSYPPFTEALPIDAGSYEEAATVALRHAESYGEFTPGLTEDEYLAGIRAAAGLADVPEGVPLLPAQPAYQELSSAGRATTGMARVLRIEYLGARSIELTVEMGAVAEDASGADLDFGEHTLLLVLEDGEWVVANTGWDADPPVGE